MDVKIVCEPKEALVDDVIHIRTTQLNPQQRVSVCCKVENEKRIFGSYAHYTASEGGVIDLKEDSAISSGMYSGVEPMGLFWSMVLAPGQVTGGQLMKPNASTPFVFDISVYTGHISWENMWDDEVGPVAKETILRWYKGKHVKRIEIEEGQIRGTLFLPRVFSPNERRPGVIDMFGIRGGLLEMRAALLASRGFVTLALAYFNYKDTPKEGSYLHYEYFEEAIKWLSVHPSVVPGGIGLIGFSLGSQIGLYMTTHCPLIKAIVAINFPPIFISWIKFKHNGQPVPTNSDKNLKLTVVNTLGYDMIVPKEKLEESMYFQFETWNNPKILFIISENDIFADVDHYVRWTATLPPERIANVEIVVYSGAGHLIEPPYSPLCVAPFLKTVNMLIFFGGETKSHAVAQEESWKKIQEFLWSNLPASLSDVHPSCPETMTGFK